jgi:cytochrome oxidase Cu insertion factor (SCO1/SenC/PrrC family)
MAPQNHLRAETLGGDFTLTDHNNQTYHLSHSRGKVVAMVFGYTTCPDVCPMALSEMSALLNGLEEQASEVQALFISVDPERDSLAKLSAYVPWFHPNILGLTGTLPAIEAVARQYHAHFTLHKSSPTDTGYTVDHNANLFLIDRKGSLAQIIPFGLPVSHKHQAITRLLAAPE